MTTRRPRGTGSVYKRHEHLWIGALPAVNDDGTPAHTASGARKRTLVYGASQEAAEAKLDALVAGVRMPASLGELRGVQAAAWAEGALWAAVELGVIKTGSVPWLAAGDNPYRP